MCQDADQIVSKVYEASGGKARWSKVNSIMSEGTLEISPGMKAPVVVYSSAQPLSQYFSLDYMGMKMRALMQDSSGWQYNPFGGKRETDPMSPDQIRENKLRAVKGLLYDYKERGFSLDYLGMDDIEGVDVFKLRLMTPSGDIVYYFIDSQTYFILKQTFRMRFRDKEEISATVFSDFRKTNYGIILPFSEQNVDEHDNPQGGPTNFSSREINAKALPDWFKKPGI